MKPDQILKMLGDSPRAVNKQVTVDKQTLGGTLGEKETAAYAALKLLQTDAIGQVKKHASRILAVSDRNAVLERHFPKNMSAQCGYLGCTAFVTLLNSHILLLAGYSLGKIDRLTVVCAPHARLGVSQKTRIADSNQINTWLHREGLKTLASCGICGRCLLRPWSADVHSAHVRASARGGSDAVDNRVVASAACNQQQGTSELCEHRDRIRANRGGVHVAIPTNLITKVKRELTLSGKDSRESSVLTRVQRLLHAQKPYARIRL
jgi:hypothetical protein